MRFWISWWQPGPDWRPVVWPPPPEILGYWCSGETMEEKPRFSVCVLIEMPKAALHAPAAARRARAAGIITEMWPEAILSESADECRFFDEVDPEWVPNDRFPLPDWSPIRKAPHSRGGKRG